MFNISRKRLLSQASNQVNQVNEKLPELRIYCIPVKPHMSVFYTAGISEKTRIDPAISMFDKLSTRVIKFGMKKLEEYGKAKRETFTGRFKQTVYSAAMRFNKQVSYEEEFLRSMCFFTIPYKNIAIVHASNVSPDKAYEDLKAVSTARLNYHSKWFILSVCCIPISMLLGALPLPNVFMAYNLYRLVSHRYAVRGSEHLVCITKPLYHENKMITFIQDSRINLENSDLDETKIKNLSVGEHSQGIQEFLLKVLEQFSKVKPKE
jgi:hypothetical protein